MNNQNIITIIFGLFITIFFIAMIFFLATVLGNKPPTKETDRLLFEYGQCKIYKFVDKNEESIFFEQCIFKEEMKRNQFKKFERFEIQDEKQMVTIHMQKVK